MFMRDCSRKKLTGCEYWIIVNPPAGSGFVFPDEYPPYNPNWFVWSPNKKLEASAIEANEKNAGIAKAMIFLIMIYLFILIKIRRRIV
jgi:hypothetical protein